MSTTTTTVVVEPMPADALAELRRGCPDADILVRLHAGGWTLQHSPDVPADELARIVGALLRGEQ